MPVLRKYKAGAIIYFEDDKSEEIYIIKSGKVALTHQDIETTNMVTDHLKNGDFFGVKAVLANFKRGEICKVESDSNILVLNRKEFENLINKNHILVLSMLKMFSTQLRRIGKMATELSASEGENLEPNQESDIATKLYKLGEHYLINNNYPYSLYIFKKYLSSYPKGDFIEKVKEQINQINEML